ncbi:MAG: hypothetical protein M3Q18_10395 [Actinomycetota bacterium]|nr:hypothetical protein [Actinomycetota bacterium]
MATSVGRHLVEAKVHFLLRNKTYAGFASFHGCSTNWISQVLNGRATPPRKFRSDLAAYLRTPEEVLFPHLYDERDAVEVAQ